MVRGAEFVAVWLSVVGCHGQGSASAELEPQAVELADHALRVAGRVIRGGAAVSGVRVSCAGAREEAVSDANGEFELVLRGEFAAAPAVLLVVAEPGRDPVGVTLPNSTDSGRLDPTLELGEPIEVRLSHASDRDQAWIDAQAWAERELRDWQRTPADHAVHLALWARMASAIADEPDPYRRGLMLAAQFRVGRADAGLDRTEAANMALNELALDDPRWAIYPWALASAAYESGRWIELGPQLDALIREHPQPDVAGYLALERYMQTSSEGSADQAAAIWQAWVDRPALARTGFASVMLGMAPKRALAPGQPLPDLCVEDLAGGTLCLAELRGELVVLEFWSTWCEGCREAVADLRAAHAELASRPEPPRFVSIDVYDDPAVITEFFATEPMPWTHGFIADPSEDERVRQAIREQLQIVSIPLLVLVDVDGTILASSPELRAGQLVDRMAALQRADAE